MGKGFRCGGKLFSAWLIIIALLLSLSVNIQDNAEDSLNKINLGAEINSEYTGFTNIMSNLILFETLADKLTVEKDKAYEYASILKDICVFLQETDRLLTTEFAERATVSDSERELAEAVKKLNREDALLLYMSFLDTGKYSLSEYIFANSLSDSLKEVKLRVVSVFSERAALLNERDISSLAEDSQGRYEVSLNIIYLLIFTVSCAFLALYFFIRRSAENFVKYELRENGTLQSSADDEDTMHYLAGYGDKPVKGLKEILSDIKGESKETEKRGDIAGDFVRLSVKGGSISLGDMKLKDRTPARLQAENDLYALKEISALVSDIYSSMLNISGKEREKEKVFVGAFVADLLRSGNREEFISLLNISGSSTASFEELLRMFDDAVRVFPDVSSALADAGKDTLQSVTKEGIESVSERIRASV